MQNRIARSRPQFTLRTLLWLMALAAAFFAGATWNERKFKQQRSDWIYLVNGQEEKFEWFFADHRRLRREHRDAVERLRQREASAKE
jgi:hypothetical protein